MSASLTDIAGLLIAGGRSVRFGEEKAMAPFRGAPLMDACARAFEPLAALVVSARPGSGAEAHARARGCDVVYDDPAWPEGPLAGVAAGLRWAKPRSLAWLATAPCDAPLLPGDLVQRLRTEIGAGRAAYALTPQGPHPLCALWRIDTLELIEARLRTGDHPAVREMLAACGAVAVRFDDDRAFTNANTRDELAALEQRP